MIDRIKILIVGDEGVGKSSLISSYISQHFSQEVPQVMTDAIIPSEMTANDVCVTLMDSSSRINDRDVLHSKIIAADSIIVTYDITRLETFDNMTSFWLPLITSLSTQQAQVNQNKKMNNVVKPVIVVGTKTDLLEDEPDISLLNHLLLDFPCVMSCWSCSAVNIQNLDQIFYLAESLVIYPLYPIFDVIEEEFTPLARCAFQRVFRIFDEDRDNLLCDKEFMNLQLQCFYDFTNTDELNRIKLRIANGIPNGISKNCVTFEGLLGLIKMNLLAHQYQVPWILLRKCGYDDNLNIIIPDRINTPPRLKADQVTELSGHAQIFLLKLAHTAWSECETCTMPSQLSDENSSDNSSNDSEQLTWEALKWILSVLTQEDERQVVYNPWNDPPSFKTQWQNESSIEQRVLLPGLSHIGATITFQDWITHWNLLAMNAPTATQVLLYKLGYKSNYSIEEYGVSCSTGTILKLYQQAEKNINSFFHRYNVFGYRFKISPRKVLHVSILGDNGVGKSSLVWSLSGLRPPGIGLVEMSVNYDKYSDCVVVGGCIIRSDGSSCNNNSSMKKYGTNIDNTNTKPISTHKNIIKSLVTSPYYISFESVPLDFIDPWIESMNNRSDLIVLMFQCGNTNSFNTALSIEAKLASNVPRMFIASKLDIIPMQRNILQSDITDMISSDPLYSSSTREQYGNNNNLLFQSLATTTGNNSSSYNISDVSKCSTTLLLDHESVLQSATIHIQEYNLPSLQVFSTYSNEGFIDTKGKIIEVVTNPLLGIPNKNNKTKLKSYFQKQQQDDDQNEYNNNTSTVTVLVTTVISIISLTAIGATVYHYRNDFQGYFRKFFNSK